MATNNTHTQAKADLAAKAVTLSKLRINSICHKGRTKSKQDRMGAFGQSVVFAQVVKNQWDTTFAINTNVQ